MTGIFGTVFPDLSAFDMRDDMAKVFLIAAGILGFLGVALGAFGAHGLRDKLSPEMMEIYKTGVLYHLVHGVALLGVAVILQRGPDLKPAVIAGYAFVFGTLVFSGSLYALAISGIRVLGAITPIGGLGFLVGWACLVWAAFRL